MASRSQIQALAARVEVLEARSRRRARVALLALIVAPLAWLEHMRLSRGKGGG